MALHADRAETNARMRRTHARARAHHHLPRFSPTAVFGNPGQQTSIIVDNPFPVPTTTPNVVVPIQTKPNLPIAQTTTTSNPIIVQPTTSSTQPNVVIPVTSSTAVTTSTTPLIVPTTSSSSVPPVLHTTSSTPTLLFTTSSDDGDVIVTQTVQTTRPPVITAPTTISSARPSQSAVVNVKSTTSTGVKVGGISAAVIAIIGITAALVYLVRRCRRVQPASDEDFNEAAFRRQSTMLPDDASEKPAFMRAASNRGGPRPPTMIERHLAGMATVPAHAAYPSQPAYPGGPGGYGATGYGQDYGYNADYSHGAAGYGAQGYPNAYGTNGFNGHASYATGSPDKSAFSLTPNSATQLLPNTPGSFATFDTRSQIAGGVAPSTLSRQNSQNGPGQDEAHYVDLNRSSVTPFQAQQYAEITRQLGNQGAGAMPMVREEKELPTPIEEAEEEQPLPTPSFIQEPPHVQAEQTDSPFADPASGTSSTRSSAFGSAPIPAPIAIPMPARVASYPVQEIAIRPASNHDSAEDGAIDEEDEGQEIAMPSPAFSKASSRITSTPPILPELGVYARSGSPLLSPGSYDFPVSVSGSPAPSPFAAHFSASPAAAGAGRSPLSQATSVSNVVEKRPETVYDPEDAYGGI